MKITITKKVNGKETETHTRLFPENPNKKQEREMIQWIKNVSGLKDQNVDSKMEVTS